MAYLIQDDYTISISVLDLTEITVQAAESSGLSSAQVLQNAYLTAEAEVRARLSSVYNVTTEFAKTSPDATRDRLVMKCLVDIALYNLHFTVNPRDIPELREKAYLAAQHMLDAFRDGVLIPLIPRLDDTAIAGSRRTEIYGMRKFISKPFEDPTLLNPELPVT